MIDYVPVASQPSQPTHVTIAALTLAPFIDQLSSLSEPERSLATSAEKWRGTEMLACGRAGLMYLAIRLPDLFASSVQPPTCQHCAMAWDHAIMNKGSLWSAMVELERQRRMKAEARGIE